MSVSELILYETNFTRAVSHGKVQNMILPKSIQSLMKQKNVEFIP